MAERRLDSWKEIGAYLGRSPRTVQRWERQEGLPVHRLRHDKLGSVYAYPTELDIWWEGRRARLDQEPVGEEAAAEAQEPSPGLPEPAAAASSRTTTGRAAAALRHSRLLVAFVAGLAVAVLAVALWFAAQPAPHGTVRLAVLPLENLGARSDDEYLAEGLTEELIAAVSRVAPERLRVIARTSVMRFKGATTPVAEIGRELGVDYVIEGSVRRSGARLRLTAQLIRVADETHVWADSFDAGLEDVLRLQAELAERVAREVRVTLTPAGRERLTREPLASAAHEAYLRARHLVARGDADDLRRAIGYFQEAARIAPDFAAAQAGIAEAYVGLAGFGYGGMRSTEAIEAARGAARRALELDSDSADAHAALGSVLFFGDWDWEGARREYDIAVALDPGDAQAHQARSVWLMAASRVEEGLAAARRALELDPLSPAINRSYVTHLYFARRYDEAIAHGRRTLELEPTDTGALDDLAELYWQKGDWEPFFETFQREGDLIGLGDWAREARAAYQRGGPKAMGEALLRRFLGAEPRPSPYLVAEINARVGNVAPALDWLERARDERVAQMVFVRQAPYFEALHGQPRFAAIVRSVGAPDPTPGTADAH